MESLMQSSTIIKTENLEKIYPLGLNTLKALDKINISVDKGEFLGLGRSQRLWQDDFAEHHRLP